MKTAEAKSSPSLIQRKAVTPFFNKGNDSFLGNDLAGNSTSFFGATQFPIAGGKAKPVQAKLTIGQPNDKYEVEADAMADKVVQRLAIQTVQTKKNDNIESRGITENRVSVIDKKCASCDGSSLISKFSEDLGGQKEEKIDIDPSLKKLQRKPIFEGNADPPEDEKSVQRKCLTCEHDELLQTSSKGSSGNLGSSNLESKLQSSTGGGTPLPAATREQMESSFGTNFSSVRIHTSSSAVQMNKELHAQAFTHGNDIYFNSGKFDPNSGSGQHLLAHELTHTIQQNGNSGISKKKIQRWPDWVSDAAGWVSDTASDVAGSVVDGAEWVGGQVVDGAQWVGGRLADGAHWVGDQVSAAVRWVFDRIRSLVNSGMESLTSGWENIKEFGRNCFDQIKNGFAGLIHFIINPLSGFMSALSQMNADFLGGMWNMVKTGANALWTGVNSVINGVVETGQRIWNGVTGVIGGVLDTVSGLFDSTAFGLLPDWLQAEARSAFEGLRSLWARITEFWTNLFQELTATIQRVLGAVRSFVENVIGFSIGAVLTMVRNLKELYDYVVKFVADPRATIQPLLDKIAEKLDIEVPPSANNLGKQNSRENFRGKQTDDVDNGTVQRAPDDSEERTTATLDEVGIGIEYYITQAWNELDIGEMLWQTVVNTFWPPATIEAIGNQFSELWNDHWATTVDSLYRPRNFFDEPIGCLHDLWSNFLILLDFPLSLWRTLNNVIGLLMGYVSILLVLAGAVLGGIAAVEVGVIPGILAGAEVGLAVVGIIGEALMASYLLAESLTVNVIMIRLFTARQLCEKRQVDILTAVSSYIVIAVVLALQFLMALLAELVNLIASLLKGGVPEPIPAPGPQPNPQPQPVVPEPVPPRPVPPQPVPPQPVPPEPVPPSPRPGPRPPSRRPPTRPPGRRPPSRPPGRRPPSPGPRPPAPAPGQQPQPIFAEAGQVVPFQSEPFTEAESGLIAAKFENDSNVYPATSLQFNVESASAFENTNTGEKAELLQNTDMISLSDSEVDQYGIVQRKETSRSAKINPDACERKKGICYERSLTYTLTRTAMTFIGVNPTPDDLRLLSCVLRSATGTTVDDFRRLNIGMGKFLVNGSFEYIPGVNIAGGDIHSEDIILIEANRRWGPGNYKLAALFSERIPCGRCAGNLMGTPKTPDCRVYSIVANDTRWSAIRRAYNEGRLF